MSGPEGERARDASPGPAALARVTVPDAAPAAAGPTDAPSAEPNRLGPLAGAVRVAFGFYRAGISPLLGPSCRYHPSCSVYAESALARFGLVRGLLLTIWRLLRCHPFARGGLDPVPARESRGLLPRVKAPGPELANRSGH